MTYRPRNITDQIVDELGSSIATGKRPAGGALPTEQQLIEEFGASRTVLREAMKVLSAKGLVTTRPRRGTIIEPETEWNLADPDILNWMLKRKNVLPLMLEFIDVRLAVEPAAAALAARHGSLEAYDRIEAALARMKDATLGDDDPILADIAFHAEILKASDNRFFWSLRHMIEVALKFSIRITNKRKGVERASYEDHKRIYDAICSRDAGQAEKLMRDMLLEAKELLSEEVTRLDNMQESLA